MVLVVILLVARGLRTTYICLSETMNMTLHFRSTALLTRGRGASVGRRTVCSICHYRASFGTTAVNLASSSSSFSLTTGPGNASTPRDGRWINVEQKWFHSTPEVGKDYPEHTLLGMPALSPTGDFGTIAEWNLKEGDSFGPGTVICSIETDKASVDFEAQDDGVIAKILRDGANKVDIPLGSPIAVVVESIDDVAAFADYVLPVEAATPAAVVESPAATSTAGVTAGSVIPPLEASGTSLLFPGARFLAESKGLDATGLSGTGKGGRVTKGDVLAALQSGTPLPPLPVKATTEPVPAPPTPPVAPVVSSPLKDLAIPTIDSHGTYEDVPNNNMRKVIAKRLTESKREVPHFYTSMEIELDDIMKLRKALASKYDVKVSVNDLIIRASALALRDVPEVNATYDPKTDSVKLQDSIDISVAVATPTGLITPIVPSTDQLGLSAITDKVRDLAGRARDGKLKPQEYQGGTFCISNLGMFGIDEFSAVINPPQAAILAVGGGTRRVVPTPYIDGLEKQPKPSIKTIMTARLSADRRVIDEATAALFMTAFKLYMKKPELMML